MHQTAQFEVHIASAPFTLRTMATPLHNPRAMATLHDTPHHGNTSQHSTSSTCVTGKKNKKQAGIVSYRACFPESKERSRLNNEDRKIPPPQNRLPRRCSRTWQYSRCFPFLPSFLGRVEVQTEGVLLLRWGWGWLRFSN